MPSPIQASASANSGLLRGEVFAGGRHIATYANGTAGTTYFDYSDWLGTLRMTATLAGYAQSECTSGPFGEGMSCAGSPTPLQFTGQQHDAETGLDHFPARSYTATWGLFTSPDDGSAQSVADGQSWDLYGYARDNPATFTDPSGRDVKVCVTTGRADAQRQSCSVMSNEQYYHLWKAQNGRQGIKMPGGTFPTGNITCGGQVCGSAQYFEPGLRDQTGALLSLVGAGDLIGGGVRLAAGAAEDLAGAVVRFFADEAPTAAGGLGDAAELVSDPAEVAARASSAVGNQSMTVPGRQVAEDAVDEFLGPDKQPLLDRNTGQQVGWRSADRQLQVRDDGSHFNFENRATGSNLHFRFPQP